MAAFLHLLVTCIPEIDLAPAVCGSLPDLHSTQHPSNFEQAATEMSI